MFSVKNCTIVIRLIATIGESVNDVQLGTPFFFSSGQLRTKTLLVKQQCSFSRCYDVEKGNARSYQEESETERSPDHSCGINTGN